MSEEDDLVLDATRRVLAFAVLMAPLPSCSGERSAADHLRAGLVARSEGRTSAALAHFDAVRTAPGAMSLSSRDHLNARFEAIRCLVELGRADRAVDEYRKLRDDHPESLRRPNAHRGALVILDDLQRAPNVPYRQVDAMLDLVCEIHPEHAARFEASVTKRYVTASDEPRIVVWRPPDLSPPRPALAPGATDLNAPPAVTLPASSYAEHDRDDR